MISQAQLSILKKMQQSFFFLCSCMSQFKIIFLKQILKEATDCFCRLKQVTQMCKQRKLCECQLTLYA